MLRRVKEFWNRIPFVRRRRHAKAAFILEKAEKKVSEIKKQINDFAAGSIIKAGFSDHLTGKKTERCYSFYLDISESMSSELASRFNLVPRGHGFYSANRKGDFYIRLAEFWEKKTSEGKPIFELSVFFDSLAWESGIDERLNSKGFVFGEFPETDRPQLPDWLK